MTIVLGDRIPHNPRHPPRDPNRTPIRITDRNPTQPRAIKPQNRHTLLACGGRHQPPTPNNLDIFAPAIRIAVHRHARSQLNRKLLATRLAINSRREGHDRIGAGAIERVGNGLKRAIAATITGLIIAQPWVDVELEGFDRARVRCGHGDRASHLRCVGTLHMDTGDRHQANRDHLHRARSHFLCRRVTKTHLLLSHWSQTHHIHSPRF